MKILKNNVNIFKEKENKDLGIKLEGMRAARRMSRDDKHIEYLLRLPDEIVPFPFYQPYVYHDYEMLPFRFLEKEQAEGYFQWFTSHMDERVEKLKEVYTKYGYDIKDLDYSEESLVKLQNFIDDNVEILDVPKEELELAMTIKQKVFAAQEYVDGVIKESEESFNKYAWDSLQKKEIGLYWCCILYDIGVYIAKMFMQNTDSKWELRLDSKYVDFNQPILVSKNCASSIIQIPSTVTSRRHTMDDVSEVLKKDGLLEGYKYNLKRYLK